MTSGKYEQYFIREPIEMGKSLVDTETMRRAQQRPDEYRDLVVRIGGFSAYFVLLTKEMQEDVIMRTEQAV